MRDKKLEKEVHELCSKFKEIRLAKGLSQRKLAEKIGLNNRAIGLIESHQRVPTILTCKKIAKGLEVDLRDLL